MRSMTEKDRERDWNGKKSRVSVSNLKTLQLPAWTFYQPNVSIWYVLCSQTARTNPTDFIFKFSSL